LQWLLIESVYWHSENAKGKRIDAIAKPADNIVVAGFFDDLRQVDFNKSFRKCCDALINFFAYVNPKTKY